MVLCTCERERTPGLEAQLPELARLERRRAAHPGDKRLERPEEETR